MRKLPLVFFIDNSGSLESLLVNPDYPLSSYGSVLLPSGGSLAIDPTGSNLYLSGPIDNSGTEGIIIYPGNGSLQPLGSIAIANLSGLGPLSFTPDGTFAFLLGCSASNQRSLLPYSRNSNGTLTAASVYALPTGGCGAVLTVSPDGKYLATGAWKLSTQCRFTASPAMAVSALSCLDPSW